MGYGYMLKLKRGGGAVERVYGGSTHIFDAARRNRQLGGLCETREEAIDHELKQKLREIERYKDVLEKDCRPSKRVRFQRGTNRRRQSHPVEAKQSEDFFASDQYIPSLFEMFGKDFMDTLNANMEAVDLKDIYVTETLHRDKVNHSRMYHRNADVTAQQTRDTAVSVDRKQKGHDVTNKDNHKDSDVKGRLYPRLSLPSTERDRLGGSSEDLFRTYLETKASIRRVSQPPPYRANFDDLF